MNKTILCSDCFTDHGLKLDAQVVGKDMRGSCPQCDSTTGKGLTKELAMELAYRFFVRGTIVRTEYGGYPRIQFNEHQQPHLHGPSWLESDIRLLESKLGIAFFEYGPRFWMFGEVEPLKALQNEHSSDNIIERILKEYPVVELKTDRVFYRLRRNPAKSELEDEYDTPPQHYLGKGRLDSPECPILYACEDLEVCLHECRVSAEDELFVASMSPAHSLRMLDLTELLEEEINEFESLDIAVNMLFLAGAHSYPICRSIAMAAEKAGYDGLLFPSYFSLLRTGSNPFETTYGISHRRVALLHDAEKAKIVPNIALFRRPIREGRVRVKSINRVILSTVRYGAQLGPVGINTNTGLAV